MNMVDTNEFYREVTKAICGSIKIETALHRLVLYLQTIMPVDEVILGLYNMQEGTVRIIASASKAGGSKISDKVVLLTQDALAAMKK